MIVRREIGLARVESSGGAYIPPKGVAVTMSLSQFVLPSDSTKLPIDFAT